jgi:hypothetical protein
MSAASDYLENKVLDHFLGTASTSAPATVYLALFTTDPTDAGSGTEVSTSGTAYSRQSIAFSSASSGSTSNSADVEFSQATGSGFGTVTHFGIFDASTAGNLLFHGSLTASKTIDAGDVFKIASGNLSITVA